MFIRRPLLALPGFSRAERGSDAHSSNSLTDVPPLLILESSVKSRTSTMSLARLMHKARNLFLTGQKQPPSPLSKPPPQPPNPPRRRRARSFERAPPTTGPPSYDTIMQRFIVGPTPYHHYLNKWGHEGGSDTTLSTAPTKERITTSTMT